ncbi:hypothetical protein LIA77_04523 [Sarocladium implicatum]|nr:hypothetical protein LIA77_04523 [Sarocladium implicatum]
MAPTPVALSRNLPPDNRPIPLLCFVCPETPKFSDVSHLLTHIASKGHLHHETQTKLRAHQDIAAALALQQYEQWYRDFEIETLLVERLRAKQVKEAARTRRTVPSLSSRGSQADASLPTVSSFDDLIKVEDDFYPDFPLLPSLFPPNFDLDMTVEHVTGPDMMTLKGQVWPGMGKMDLANDEMKRTRNQRKPKSVIERMRRASQGIEPTEVVMSTDLEVERTRGVYDKTSSPEPDESDKARLLTAIESALLMNKKSDKKPKSRRKRPAALTEISVNIPRGTGSGSLSAKVVKPTARHRQSRHRDANNASQATPSFQSIHHSQQTLADVDDTFNPAGWSDELSIRSAHTLGSFPYATFATAQGANR